MLETILERFNYIPIIILMMTGLYVVIATGNLIKRLVGLSLFQTSVFLLYITIGKVFGGQPPILESAHHGEDEGYGSAGGYGAEAAAGYAGAGSGDAEHADDAAHGAAETAAAHGEGYGDAAHHTAEVLYSNPLPHVLILTAIVVGVATLAVGLALVVRIREAYGTIEDDALNAADYSRETGSSE